MDFTTTFIKKNKIAISILIFLILSLFVIIYASAEEDIYANQIEVKDAKIIIKDGTPNTDGNFDSNDEVGYDSSNSNQRVRNFDSIEYEIIYNLTYKEDSSLDEKPLDPIRSVIVDVLLPKTIKADISEGDLSTPFGSDNIKSITINSIEYNYYTFLYNDAKMTDKNSTKINIAKINSKNGTEIKPIIRIRESTDENYNDYTNDSNINDSLDIKQVVVTAKDAWDIKLYNGVVTGKEIGSATLPVGIAIYLPDDSNRGIKGLQIPNELSFDITISSDSDASQVNETYISNYNENGDYVIGELPYSYEYGNGKANIVKDNVYKITYKDLSFHDKTINIGTEEEPIFVNYVSTKQLIINTKRVNLENKTNITYTISVNDENIKMLDNYTPFVGDYLSKVDFINSNNIQISGTASEPTTTLPNSAIYNYNEEFYIQNTIKYGFNLGDNLENGFTNYLKIDNTAIKLLDVGNLSDESLDYYINFSEKDSNREYSVEYGIGEWNSNYFKVKSDKPSYCPTNLTKLSKEQLMNYYGGPCIEENDNLKWYSSIEEAAIKDENNRNKIIVVRLNVNSEYKVGTTTTMRFKAVVKNNIGLIGNSYQVIARGVTTWNQEKFYMYEAEKDKVPVNLSKQASDINYSKLEYDNVAKVVSKEESPKAKYGNSIIVSSLKASINEIKVLDKNDSEKNVIYFGQNDPMEIQIRPVIYKSDMNAEISKATINVTIPTTMTVAILKGDRKPVGNPTESIDANGNRFLTYTYVYEADEIKKEGESAAGTIPVLKIHAYVSINTLNDTSATIKATISGMVKPNIDATTEIDINTPIEYRTNTKDIMLKNNNDITVYGSISTNYIDKNEKYLYNAKTVNLVNENAELNLLYILPYNGDSIASTYGSNYTGKLGISIVETLPQGYEVYYTKDNPKNILNNELNNLSNITWTKWINYNTALDGITAIKIVSNGLIKKGEYFGSSNGITFNMNTNGNKELDIYYNKLYVLHKNGMICKEYNDDLNECKLSEIGSKVFGSNISSVSVYNRTISGYAFEDTNYDGIYSNKEPRLSDIIVELYKTDSKVENPKLPFDVISENDKLIEESTTDLKGSYKFSALESGNYYVKYKFNCDKYTLTEKNKQDPTISGDISLIDSDADMLSIETCTAISNIVTLNNTVVAAKNIDLGLRVRQDFDIKLNKYITNVTIQSNKGTQSYDYDRKSIVNIPVKNLKNTSFKVSYLIEIENSRYFPGTIGNIIETIPEGMTFNPNIPENDGWYESGGNLYYEDLNKALIMPGEKYYLTIVLDLVTNNGGDYINFVAAKDLKTMPVITNFVEAPVETGKIKEDITITDEEKEEGGYQNE